MAAVLLKGSLAKTHALQQQDVNRTEEEGDQGRRFSDRGIGAMAGALSRHKGVWYVTGGRILQLREHATSRAPRMAGKSRLTCY